LREIDEFANSRAARQSDEQAKRAFKATP
jgi:hypothetical protein